MIQSACDAPSRLFAEATHSSQLLFDTPDVFLLSLTLPGEDGNTGGSDSGSSVVLSGEDVARRPGDLSTQVGQGLDQDSTAKKGFYVRTSATSTRGVFQLLTFEWSCKVWVFWAMISQRIDCAQNSSN